MSTRAYIVRKTETGYEGIYNHYDGYPARMIPILEHYKTEIEVKTLICMGHVSSLAKNIYDSHFYHRDTNEDLRIDTFTPEELSKQFDYVDYIYVFDKGKWSEFKKLKSESSRTLLDELREKYSECLSNAKFDMIVLKLVSRHEDPNDKRFPDLFEAELNFIEEYNRLP